MYKMKKSMKYVITTILCCTIANFSFMIFTISYSAKIRSTVVVTLDVNEVLNSFINIHKNDKIDINKINELTDGFSAKLSKYINEKSKSENLLVIPRQIVIAGTNDITSDVKNEVLGGRS